MGWFEWLVWLAATISMCRVAYLRGVHNGAGAVLGMETHLRALSEKDRERLRQVFDKVDLARSDQVSTAAAAAAEVYDEAIRRSAFEDVAAGRITAHDRMVWQREFGREMPCISFDGGYSQAVKDLIAGADECARKFLDDAACASILNNMNASQKRLDGVDSLTCFYSDCPDGRMLGSVLVCDVVMRTFERAAQDRGATSGS